MPENEAKRRQLQALASRLFLKVLPLSADRRRFPLSACRLSQFP